MTTRILIHGGWSGGFAWEQVARHLRADGKEVVVVDRLPTTGTDPDTLGTSADNVAALRRILDGLDGPARLVGHSYGGWAVTEVADHPAVESSVYVTAFWPEDGERLADLTDGAPPGFVEPFGGSSLRVVADVHAVHAALAPDADREVFDAAFAQYGLQAMTTFTAPAVVPAERTDETTYVICTQDRSIPLARQEAFAAKADHTVRLESSHCPHLAMPAQLASLL